MWIILKIDNELFKMINTDVCACFQNVNGELGFEHGNYRHTISTSDIADVQKILDYIAYCLKQKKYICEIPSEEYNKWKSIFIKKEKVFNYIPVGELQKLYKKFKFDRNI